VRRVRPHSLRGRVLGYGLFSGAIGGAFFVHEHGSFDYTALAPAWLAVAMFVALPLLFGVTVAALVELADREGGLGRRVPLSCSSYLLCPSHGRVSPSRPCSSAWPLWW
jgi:hypothetical protein